jgi:hypothetical protein
MTVEPYPNDADLQELTEAHDLLTTAGVAAGKNGFDLDSLAAAAYVHGWSYRIDRAAGLLGYQAELRPQSGVALQPFVNAVGWEPEVAMALALARALTRRRQRADTLSGGHKASTEAAAE